MFVFEQRKKLIDLTPHVRRICDLTAPNSTASGALLRAENRYNRILPAVLCPWENRQPDVERCRVVLTKDLCDRGVGLVLNHPMELTEVLVGFWPNARDFAEPSYFIGRAVRNAPLGGGFWCIGVELTEYANSEHRAKLQPLQVVAKKLLSDGGRNEEEE